MASLISLSVTMLAGPCPALDAPPMAAPPLPLGLDDDDDNDDDGPRPIVADWDMTRYLCGIMQH